MQLYFWAARNYHFVVVLNLKYPLIVEIIRIFAFDKQVRCKIGKPSSHSFCFLGVSNPIQNDLINAIQISMLNEIEKELTEANFVAILLDETSDVSNFAQLSTVFRYVTKDCAAKEQFIGFTDVSGDRTAEALSEYVLKCIETWKCKNKLIAQTYDGAATMAGKLNK